MKGGKLRDPRKKLLLMIPSLDQGGFERVCVKTAHLLGDAYDVTLLIFYEGEGIYDVSELHVENLRLPPEKSAAGRIVNVLRRVWRTSRIKKRERADLSYSFGLSANLVNVLSGGSGRRLTGLRCSTDMESPRLLRLFLDRSDRVLSCSAEIMRELERDHGYTRTSLIYNPLDVEDIRAKAKETVNDLPFDGADVTRITAVARDDVIKGLWHLIKAFSLLCGQHDHVRLQIIGAGDYQQARALCDDLGIAEHVAFTGVKKNPFPYVARTDLYVLSSNHEGFPNALLEAMALGRPVIAADCKTGPREIVLSEEEQRSLLQRIPDGQSVRETIEGAYGVLIPDMSAQPDYDAARITQDDRNLYAAMEEMIADPARMKHYGEQASARAAMFSPARYREELIRILDAEV